MNSDSRIRSRTEKSKDIFSFTHLKIENYYKMDFRNLSDAQFETVVEECEWFFNKRTDLRRRDGAGRRAARTAEWIMAHCRICPASFNSYRGLRKWRKVTKAHRSEFKCAKLWIADYKKRTQPERKGVKPNLVAIDDEEDAEESSDYDDDNDENEIDPDLPDVG